jgi:hypothetical protein
MLVASTAAELVVRLWSPEAEAAVTDSETAVLLAASRAAAEADAAEGREQPGLPRLMNMLQHIGNQLVGGLLDAGLGMQGGNRGRADFGGGGAGAGLMGGAGGGRRAINVQAGGARAPQAVPLGGHRATAAAAAAGTQTGTPAAGAGVGAAAAAAPNRLAGLAHGQQQQQPQQRPGLSLLDLMQGLTQEAEGVVRNRANAAAAAGGVGRGGRRAAAPQGVPAALQPPQPPQQPGAPSLGGIPQVSDTQGDSAFNRQAHRTAGWLMV